MSSNSLKLIQLSEQDVAALEEILEGLLGELDPASVTMTSTNIPDAIVKLSSVLAESSEATQKVFTLIETQSQLITQSESNLAALEQAILDNPLTTPSLTTYLQKQHSIHHALRNLSHGVIMTQEFQDLCGQKIKKIMKLLCEMECHLKALFGQLHIDLPSSIPSKQSQSEEKEMDQAAADKLLKELGL